MHTRIWFLRRFAVLLALSIGIVTVVVLAERILPAADGCLTVANRNLVGLFDLTTALGDFYRRKQKQGGPLYAQVATANKIARTVYHMLKYHVQQDMGAEEFERQHRKCDLKALRKKAAKLGFTLIESQSVQAAA